MLSVVIPTLNEEKMLGRCLDSLCYQLDRGDEVVIIDGGSTDSTIEIARKYGCRTVHVGPSTLGEARHIGTKLAKNSIVLNTDADVVFSQKFVDRLKDHYADDEVVAVSGLWLDGKNRLLGNFTCKVLENAFGYADCIISYRKSAYERVGGYPLNVNFGEQFILWNRLRGYGKTVQDPKLVVHHYSDRNINIPSYILGSSLMGLGGILYSRHETVGLGVMGLGLGTILGQIGVDAFSYVHGAPTNHLHHAHIGAMVAAAGLGIYAMDHKSLGAGLIGTGIGLFVHDLLTEPRPSQD